MISTAQSASSHKAMTLIGVAKQTGKSSTAVMRKILRNPHAGISRAKTGRVSSER
ncbi:hypothetical protein RKLH11_3970 [Rhodobacteraceae bacterium KLH11]|nr:hypothetical protein RKLH11_3970 [Rhodobacteraceae bacterium KLH11]